MAITYNDYQTGYSGVTASDVGDMIGITPTTAESTLIDKLVTQTEYYVCNYCNRQFDETPEYEQRIVGGGQKYYLGAYPINEINTITYEGELLYDKDGTGNVLELGTDFIVTDDYVEFITNYYITAYSSLDGFYPDNAIMDFTFTIKKFWGVDIVTAIEQLAGNTFNGRDTGNKDVTSVSSGTYSVSFDGAVSSMVNATLNKYKKVLI